MRFASRIASFTLAPFALAAVTLAGAASPASAASYAVDPTHTFATFEIGHFGASVNRGRFDKKEGTVTFDKTAKTGKVDITFHIDSINSGTPAFDQHLKTAVFEAAQHPTARFVGDTFTFAGERLVSVAGQLTLKGQTRPVTFTANQFTCYDNMMLKREVCGGDFEATIDRTAFGVDWGVEYGFPSTVRIVAQLEAVKQ